MSANIAADWIILRKSKKAAITKTAIDGICREAEKAGMSLETALRHACERGWAGFKAEWVNYGGKNIPIIDSKQQNKSAAYARLFGRDENEAI